MRGNHRDQVDTTAKHLVARESPGIVGDTREARGMDRSEGPMSAADVAFVQRVREARRIVRDRESGAIGLDRDGDLVGWIPPLYPEWLGGRSFTEAHGLRFPYATGSMANGIATPRAGS